MKKYMGSAYAAIHRSTEDNVEYVDTDSIRRSALEVEAYEAAYAVRYRESLAKRPLQRIVKIDLVEDTDETV